MGSDPAFRLSGAADSGIADVTVWQGTSGDGSQVNVVFARRSDQMGSYMMILNGPQSQIDNEGRYEQLLDSLKAEPAR